MNDTFQAFGGAGQEGAGPVAIYSSFVILIVHWSDTVHSPFRGEALLEKTLGK